MKPQKIDADVVIGSSRYKAVCEFVQSEGGKVSIIVHIKDDEGALPQTSMLSFDENKFEEACSRLFAVV